ncbi:hypothetical protein MKW92_004793, partial [Papaver armeniacum]
RMFELMGCHGCLQFRLKSRGSECMDEISHQDLNAIELGQDNVIAKRGRGRPPTPITADKGMALGNNGVELEMENAIELEQDNAIAERGRGRPPKNNSGRTGRPPTNADKKSDYLTRETVREKWLGKLLQDIEYVCDSKECGKDEHKEKCGSLSLEKETSLWPDVAVTAIVALEKASHDAFSGDSEKYKKIVRQFITVFRLAYFYENSFFISFNIGIVM